MRIPGSSKGITDISIRSRRSRFHCLRQSSLVFVVFLFLCYIPFARPVPTSSSDDNENQWHSNQDPQQKRRRKRNPFRSDDSQWTGMGGKNKNKQLPPIFNMSSQFPWINANSTQALTRIFPTRQPRHILEGLVTFVRSVLTGFGLALVTFVVLPILGFRQARWPGLAAGSVAGALYSVVFAVIGLTNGAYQVMRGLLITPRALQAHRKGQVWDTNMTEWRFYYLQEELDELTSYCSYQDPTRQIRDMVYYELLGIPTNALPRDIKRAFYRKAKHVHPDKNLGENDGGEGFRQLHTAYMTLYNDEKRAIYDQLGVIEALSGTSNNNSNSNTVPEFFDVYVFYGVLFGSQLVDSYVGDLSIAAFTDQLLQLQRAGPTNPKDLIQYVWSSDNLERRKRLRQVEIAMFLQNRVANFVNGTLDEMKFRATVQAEAKKIASGPFGRQYLTAIGRALSLESIQFSGTQQGWLGWFRLGVATVKKNAGKVKDILTVIKEIYDIFKMVPQLQADMKANKSEIERMEAMIPEVIDVAWAYINLDIRKTLRGACRRLFSDASSIFLLQRLQLAEAVRIIGEEFLKIGIEPVNKHKMALDHMARVEVAYQVAVMKGSGQDVPDDLENTIMMRRRGVRQ